MTITKRSRHWAIHDEAGELVCIAVYRKGAREVVRRLAPEQPLTEPKPPSRIRQERAVYTVGSDAQS